jgi:hypothetical protein
MLKTREIVFVVLSVSAFWIVILVLQSDATAYGEICEYTQAGQKECTTHHIILVALWKIQKVLNDIGATITALATIAIAVFTYTLKKSTDKLWDAGERQLKSAQEAAAEQSGLMSRSVAAAANTAAASMRHAIAAESSLENIERPYIFVFGVSPIRMGVTGEFFVEYSVANYGKMPAIIDGAFIGFVFSDTVEPPSAPLMEDSHTLLASPILQSGEKRENIIEYLPIGMITPDINVEVRDDSKPGFMTPIFDVPKGSDVFFRATIEYHGPSSEGHETSALWLVNYPSPGQLAQRGGDKYNYTR